MSKDYQEQAHLEDLAFIWNEAEELSCSLRELTDDELIDCRDALLDRVKAIMTLTEGAVE